jgi:hypothetical protein
MAFTDQEVADFIASQGWAGTGQPVNASAIFGAAQGNMVDASQLDRVGAANGWWGNTGATDWVTSKGLGGALGTQAPTAQTMTAPALQIGGTPTPAAMSPASPGAPTVPAGAGTWIQPGLGAPTGGWAGSSKPSGSYMPAGGPGSNFGNDPRMGGPGQWGGMGGLGGMTGNQGFGGLMQYLWQNPSTMAMGNEMTRQVNNNLQRNILPGIRRNAMVDGVSGGSGQGIAEGLAIGDSMGALAGSLAGLYGNQFNQDRGYGLQSDALDYNIHRGNLQDMRTGQLDQLGFMDQMTKWGQQGIGAATQVQNTPLTRWQQFSDTGARLGGLGSQQSQQLQGNPWLSAAGGWMAGQKMFGG